MDTRTSEHRWLVAALLLATAMVTGCGGKQSVASKSAAAYREAQKSGMPAGEDSHGGHAAAIAQSATATMDHATMTGMGQSQMAGMDHSKMQQGQQGMAGMQHSQTQQGQQGMAGMQHGQMQQGQQGMAGMQHGQMAPGPMQPGAIAPLGAAPPTVEVKSAEARPGQPAATLSADALDAPVPTSVADAARNAEMAQMMASGGHGMAHGEYVQQDVGRDSIAPMQQDNMPGMQHGTPPAPQPQRSGASTRPADDAKPAAVYYTCPMHPEVRSDRPGKCPKCGMTLVKKEKK